MRVKLVVVLMAVMLLIGYALPVGAGSVVEPHAFYGAVTINGNPAPIGTVIEARGNNVRTGLYGNPIETTQTGYYGSSDRLGPKLVVQGIGIAEGTIITFYVSEVAADQTAEFHAGAKDELNLEFTLPERLPTTTTVTSSRHPSQRGQSVTFTATVSAQSPATGTPSGTVVFNDGVTFMASRTLDGSGQASYSTSSLSTGTHNIKAVYAGDTLFLGSTGGFTQSVRSSSNGGGSGGQAPTPTPTPTPTTPTPSPNTTDLNGKVDSDGKFTEDVTASSEDGVASVTIPRGVTGKTAGGTPLTEITVVRIVDPEDIPPPGGGFRLGSYVYHFSPDGAQFDQPVTITIRYDPSLLNNNFDVSSLAIDWYDVKSGQWLELPSTVNTSNLTVSAQTTYFTNFAVLSAPRPAIFAVSKLQITPSQADIGKPVTISVVVTNTGGLSGSYTVNLKINGAIMSTQSVTLGSGESQTVTFTNSQNTAGSFTVGIDNLTGTFSVAQPATPAPVSTPAQTTPAPPVTTPAPTPGPTPAVNWWLIGIIILVCVVIVLVVWILRARQKAK